MRFDQPLRRSSVDVLNAVVVREWAEWIGRHMVFHRD
jgi:hypothetical protein